MKRLTGRAPDGTAYLYNMGGTNAAIDRLAAYEDTGLEPEEISIRRWIPVMERVPGIAEMVLVYSGCRLGIGPAWRTSFSIPAGAWDTYCNSVNVGMITHWMPLPEPPEEVTQDD